MIKKWILLGPANAKKAEIVMEKLLSNPVVQVRPFVFVCESEEGCAFDFAISNNVEVARLIDPKMKTLGTQDFFDKLGGDLLVSCGWNYKIPNIIFNRFKFHSLNCHSSLLPDYKGQRAYVHQWANCEEEYGVTIHLLAEDLDAGKIILQGGIKLFLKENLVMMHQRLSEVTGFLLPQALLLIESGYNGIVHSESQTSRYFFKISRWKAKAHRITNRSIMRFGLKPILTPHQLF